MNGEFSFTGHRSCQVPSSAGVNTGVFRTSVQDHQGAFIIIVHKCVMAALRQQGVILKANAVSFSNGSLKIYNNLNIYLATIQFQEFKNG